MGLIIALLQPAPCAAKTSPGIVVIQEAVLEAARSGVQGRQAQQVIVPAAVLCVAARSYGTAMMRQPAKEQAGIGVGHTATVMPAQLALRTSLGIAIMRHHVKALLQIGAGLIARAVAARHAAHQ